MEGNTKGGMNGGTKRHDAGFPKGTQGGGGGEKELGLTMKKPIDYDGAPANKFGDRRVPTEESAGGGFTFSG